MDLNGDINSIPPAHPLENHAWRSDYTLSEETQQEFRGLLNGLENILDNQDAKISHVRATLNQLLDERKSYTLRMDRLKSALAPHKKLPPEIFSKIFTDCSPSPLSLPPRRVVNRYLSPPMAVCSRWRQIAIHSLDLWDSITIAYPSYHPVQQWVDKTDNITSLAREIILRGTRSVGIRIYGSRKSTLPDKANPLRSLVTPFSQQFTHIKLMCSMHILYEFMQSTTPLFPVLKSLTLLGEEHPNVPFSPDVYKELSMFENAPLLREFSLIDFHLDFLLPLSRSSLHLPWDRLTKIILCSTWTDVRTAYTIFTQCTSARTCWFSLLFVEEETLNVAFPLPTIVHPHLQRLTISSTSGSPDVATRFLQSLVLPSLCSIEFTDIQIEDTLPTLLSLIPRSRCTIRTFTVTKSQVSALILEQIIELMPLLEEFTAPKVFIPIPMLELMAQGLLLPKLTSLDCTIYSSPRSLDAFMDAVERSSVVEQTAGLRVASARYAPGSRNYAAPRWPQVKQRFNELAEKLHEEGRLLTLKG